MSVKVDLEQLESALAEYSFAYVVTVSEDHRAHTVAVTPVLADGVFTVDAFGGTTKRNAEAHPDITLVWPPRDPSGYTLIVDGRCELTDEAMRVTPDRAVLHRMPNDCMPLEPKPQT
ncbi:MAG TPA: pyridoxamine 5'-phosphate oxidase family protein [Mycobacterium sp.]|nr:pyridoxamine 5'-phosphate oxidase family protein [Mycobacterium sp.]